MSLFAWIKINPTKQLSEEQRKKIAEDSSGSSLKCFVVGIANGQIWLKMV